MHFQKTAHTACVSECFSFALFAAPHRRAAYTCRTHAACFVMLVYTRVRLRTTSLYEHMWKYGRGLMHYCNLCQLAPGSVFKTNVNSV